jgi:hypothetical protein
MFMFKYFFFEPDMPDEIRYQRKFNNTSMSASGMDFGDINAMMNVNILFILSSSFLENFLSQKLFQIFQILLCILSDLFKK